MSVLDRLRKTARGEPLRAALYARFSSDNQRNESIDAQVRAIKEFAHANNIAIVAEYIDRAKSATTDDRPDFQRMIQDSAKGDFQLLIVHKLDRFARNRNDSIAYRMKLQRNHITLLSVLEPFDEDRPETILLQSVIEGMNEFYSKNLSREVKKGLKENALKCVHTGGTPPLGYDVDKETRRLVINEHEAEAVRLIFQMVVAGHGYMEIMNRLKQDGYKTKAKRDFGKNSIYEILHNRKYKGDYIFNRVAGADPYTKKRNNHLERPPEDMIIIPGGVPAIVDEDTFEKVQEILRSRQYRSYHSRRNKEVYLLSGKIVCGLCGYMYVGNRKNSAGRRKPHITYRCNNRGRKTGAACANREVNRDYVEQFVVDQIEKAIFNKRMAQKILRDFQRYMREKNVERQEKLRRLERLIQECQKKQANVAEILAEGVDRSQRGVLLAKIEQIETERLGLQERWSQEKAELDLDVPSLEELERCFEKARQMFRNRTLEEMKSLIDLYVEKVVVFEDEIQVILNLVSSIYHLDIPREVSTITREALNETFKVVRKRCQLTRFANK